MIEGAEEVRTEYGVKYATGTMRIEGSGPLGLREARREVARVAHNAGIPGVTEYSRSIHPAVVVTRKVVTQTIESEWEEVPDEV